MNKLLIGLLAITFLASCNKNLLKDDDIVPLSQFADRVIEFSSEYSASPGPWSSFVVLGAPDTYPQYGDIQTAWAPKTSDSPGEFLAVTFDTAQYVNQIDIYETYNPGAITSVEIRNAENGNWVQVYVGAPELNLAKQSRIKKIDFPQAKFTVDAVRIWLASQQVSGWNEIDAVIIIGEYERD